MGHHKDNDELRKDRFDQEKRREDLRDEALEGTDGGSDDLGSQDERRKEGRNAPDLDRMRKDDAESR